MDLSNVRKIISHLNCSDGTVSAMLLSHALPEAEVAFLQYSTPQAEALEPEPGLLFCDFAPRHRIDEFLEAGAIVLDHHDTVQDVVQRFVERGQGAYGDEVTSGALLAYKHVWYPRWNEDLLGDNVHQGNVARLAHLATVRDNWMTTHKDWEEACIQHEMIKFFPTNYWLDRTRTPDISHNDVEWMVGKVSYEKYQRKITRFVQDNVFRTSWGGLSLAIFAGGGAFASDVSEKLRQHGANICIGFFYAVEEDKPKVCFSVRSDHNFSSGNFAKFHGGGGHERAGGFSIPVQKDNKQPFNLIIDLLDRFSRTAPIEDVLLLDKSECPAAPATR